MLSGGCHRGHCATNGYVPGMCRARNAPRIPLNRARRPRARPENPQWANPPSEVELVGRVLAPGGAGAVVHAGGVARGVAGGVLDGGERDAAVEQERDEGVAEAVGVDAVDLVVALADEPGLLGELAEQPVDRLAVVGDARAGRSGAQRRPSWRRKIGPCERAPTVFRIARSVRSLRATSTSLPPLPRTTSEWPPPGSRCRFSTSAAHSSDTRSPLSSSRQIIASVSWPRSVATASSPRTWSSVMARPRGSRRSFGPLTPAAGEPGITRRSAR